MTHDDRRVVFSTNQNTETAKLPTKKRKKTPNPSSQIKSTAKQGIRIRRESKGRGGKTVSIIDGLSLADNDLKVLLKKLKNQLGTGGTIKNSCIEIQGDHRNQLIILLEKQGYKAKLAGG
ncbi:MAG: translation initiation factor [Mariprofundaceae bacterium]